MEELKAKKEEENRKIKEMDDQMKKEAKDKKEKEENAKKALAEAEAKSKADADTQAKEEAIRKRAADASKLIENIDKPKAVVTDAMKQVSAVQDKITKVEEKKTLDFKK